MCVCVCMGIHITYTARCTYCAIVAPTQVPIAVLGVASTGGTCKCESICKTIHIKYVLIYEMTYGRNYMTCSAFITMDLGALGKPLVVHNSFCVSCWFVYLSVCLFVCLFVSLSVCMERHSVHESAGESQINQTKPNQTQNYSSLISIACVCRYGMHIYIRIII